MAVAESSVASKTPAGLRESSLGWASLAGGLALLGGFGLVFGALPVIWTEMLPTNRLNEFLSSALLLIVGIAALVAVCFVWYKLDRAFPAPGVRAGAFVAATAIFFSTWIVFALGNAMDKPGQESIGMVMAIAVAALLATAIVFLFTRPAFGRWLVSLDEAGWFTNQPFKGNQGVRVRRATVFGLLVIGLTGVYAMSTHHLFGSSRTGASDWFWRVPFSSSEESYLYVPLLWRVNVLGPILLSAAIFWVSWRLVNWPTFADFLIATEAEINKVSWTTRKRLVTDTIVVLVAVFLMTTFLFGIDILWFQILSGVKVLHVDLKAEQAKQQEKTQW